MENMRRWRIIVNDLVHGVVRAHFWATAVAESVQFLENGYLYGRGEIVEIKPIVLDAEQHRISVHMYTESGAEFVFHLQEEYAEEL